MSESLAFDYVIVGAGTAGCVLANRLSEDPRRSVCLIEAGGPDRSPLISTPLAVLWLMKHPRFNWNYMTVPQPALDGRQVIIPRGKALGGSTAINGMVYIRGLPSDFDGWARQGCAGWSYSDVLPYFRRSEANERLGPPYHGTNGEVPVTDFPSPEPVTQRFLKAAEALQLPLTDDFSGAQPEGFGHYQTYTRDGRRVTASAAFLEPIRNRPNLTILSGRSVKRLLIAGSRVVGVETDRDNVTARAEVLLCAGTIGSPQLLQLSGIGPGGHLRRLGIPVARDVPAVGANFHDHPNVMLLHRSIGTVGHGISLRAMPRLAMGLADYAVRRRGMWASNLSEAGGFARTDAAMSDPDVQFHFVPFWRSTVPGRILAWGHGYALHVCALRPKSRGSVMITSADSSEKPAVDPALLAEEADRRTMLDGVKLARRILQAPPLAEVSAGEALPERAENDDDLMAFIRQRTATIYHPVGTCRMGSDETSVVDPQLRLRGVDGLRVVDASVMPQVTSGNTNAATMMIAEKAADMIRSA